MKKWVRPYLLKAYETFFDKLGGDLDLKKARIERIAYMLEDDEAVLWELSSKVNSHFTDFWFGSNGWYFATFFGDVLANLPKGVFMRLVGMRNVFYTFAPNPGAEVKPFLLDEEGIIQWERVIIVTFPYESVFMPIAALRGSIVHELVHVYLHSDEMASNDAMEEEADRVAREWGFDEEIAAMRKYYEQYELEEQQETTHDGALLTQEQQYPTNNDTKM